MVGALSRLEVSYYMEDSKCTLESINAYRNKDVEIEVSKTETREKRIAKQAHHGRGQTLCSNSVGTDTLNGRFRPRFSIIDSFFF